MRSAAPQARQVLSSAARRCWSQRQERNPYLFLCPLGQKILKEFSGIRMIWSRVAITAKMGAVKAPIFKSWLRLRAGFLRVFDRAADVFGGVARLAPDVVGCLAEFRASLVSSVFGGVHR